MGKEGPLKAIAGAPDRPLIIGDLAIPCYVLEDETRVSTQRGMISSLNMARGSAGSRGGGDRLKEFVAGKAITPFISREIRAVIVTPVRFRPPTGGVAYGYPATLLADLCDAAMDARSTGVLRRQQLHIATRCELLVRGFGPRAFPYAFYQKIFRLNRWPGPDGMKRPSVIGHYTSDSVYERLAPGVLEELRERNPTLPVGYRRNRHHQWFTLDLGHPKLKEHLAVVTALMRAAPNWESFKRSVNRALPKHGETIELPLDDYSQRQCATLN